jgi:hypothetical protein
MKYELSIPYYVGNRLPPASGPYNSLSATESEEAATVLAAAFLLAQNRHISHSPVVNSSFDTFKPQASTQS